MPTGFIKEAREFLADAGYLKSDLVENCSFTVRSDDGSFSASSVDLVAFAQPPHDMRNACIAVIDSHANAPDALSQLRFLKTPLAIAGYAERVELWSVRKTIPDRAFDVHDRSEWKSRLSTRLSDYSPTTIMEAKDDRIQLEFVDAGLEPWTQSIASASLTNLLEELIRSGIDGLPAGGRHNDTAHNDVLRLIFHLFACRALEDKGVINAQSDAATALRTANELFSENIKPEILQSRYISQRLANEIFETLKTKFSFATLTTEILSHSYENALVTKKGRRALGIYYTPRSITEYIFRRLPIETIPEDKRMLWDPCCGCGSFLLAGFDRLSRLLPDSMTPRDKHNYLRKRIFGSDEDAFARELASLALVLTDLHNRNGWRVDQADATQILASELPGTPSIIATNLPFLEIKEGKGKRRELSAEILSHVIDLAADDALFGAIVPQSFLDSNSAASARRKIMEKCEILEIALLPSAFFKSATETAVLMLRKRSGGNLTITTVRELRASEFHRFDRNASFTRTYPVESLDWRSDPEARFHVSPLIELWQRLEKEFPKLGSMADVKNGLQIKKTDRTSVSEKKRSGDRRYVDRLDVLRPFALLTEIGVQKTKWIEYGPQLHRQRSEEIFRASKVLINSNRNPGSAWRLVAAISRVELYFSDNFHAVIPKGSVSVEQLAALLNSPIANAWFDSRCKKRKVVQKTLEQLPIPRIDERLGTRLNEAVRAMEDAMQAKWKKESEGMFYDGMIETSDTAMRLNEIDQLIYDAYGLAKHERRHIDILMNTDRRPG